MATPTPGLPYTLRVGPSGPRLRPGTSPSPLLQNCARPFFSCIPTSLLLHLGPSVCLFTSYLYRDFSSCYGLTRPLPFLSKCPKYSASSFPLLHSSTHLSSLHLTTALLKCYIHADVQLAGQKVREYLSVQSYFIPPRHCISPFLKDSASLVPGQFPSNWASFFYYSFDGNCPSFLSPAHGC